VTVAGNTAILGGGLFNEGTATLRNVTVAGNAAGVGGGIANFGPLSLAHVTLHANHARFARALFNGRTARLIRRWRPMGARMGIPPVLRRIPVTRSAAVMLAVAAEQRTSSIGPIPWLQKPTLASRFLRVLHETAGHYTYTLNLLAIKVLQCCRPPYLQPGGCRFHPGRLHYKSQHIKSLRQPINTM
jgi:hypothetical protein